jgi:hypothetical protein
VPTTEPIPPNPTESSVAGDTHPLGVGQIAAASLGSRQMKKNILLASKYKQPTPLANQVTIHIELSPYHGPQSPLDLVAVEIVFGHLFEAFQHSSQAASTGAPAGVDTQLTKKAQALPSRRMLAPRYLMILLLFLLLLILILILTSWLFIGNLWQVAH